MDTLKEKVQNLPNQPGVYLFKGADGRVIYVGKAKVLRQRVLQYFGADKRPQLPFLMADAQDLDYTVVNSELEALFLESTLIKQYMPAYNIKLRDDKNYAFISIDYKAEIPRIGYSRTIEKTSGVKYFGPYSSAKKIKQTLDTVRRIFPYCSNDKVGTRPCFYFFLHRCPGVCVGAITLDEYRAHLERIALFLSGKTSEVTKELIQNMRHASRSRQFERAAKLRDQLQSLTMLGIKQIVAFPTNADWDFISLASEGPNACVNLFKVRSGKLIDKDNFIFDARLQTPEAVTQTFTERYYADTSDPPQSIFTEYVLDNEALVQELLKSRSKRLITVSSPLRGHKHDLIRLGAQNAKEFLDKWQRSSAENRDTINQALLILQTVLKLPTLPNRIECYDMSNTQGTNPVGSMVVFECGLPAKSEYRKFKIRLKDTPDDFAMMREVLARRLAKISNFSPFAEATKDKQFLPMMHRDLTTISNEISKQREQIISADQNKIERTWPVPDLIVIDGGKGQLSAAVSVRDGLGLTVPMIGLAKRIEEIFVPGDSVPIVLPHDNPALQMLQRLRDEAHRFGITFHRQLRSKQAVRSALDEIPGIGPKTKKLLKTKFGTVDAIKKIDFDILVSAVGKQKAELVRKYL